MEAFRKMRYGVESRIHSGAIYDFIEDALEITTLCYEKGLNFELLEMCKTHTTYNKKCKNFPPASELTRGEFNDAKKWVEWEKKW